MSMKTLLLLLMVGLSVSRAVDPIEPPAAPGKAPRPVSSARTVREYSGDELDLILRTLARQMNMNLVVGEGVKGHVTLRVTDKTPREVFDIIVEANGYKSYDRKGVTYVVLKNQEQIDANRAMAREKKALYDALVAEGFTKDEALKILLAGIGPTRAEGKK
jgi:type II secretory pathway component HofQ